MRWEWACTWEESEVGKGVHRGGREVGVGVHTGPRGESWWAICNWICTYSEASIERTL